MIYKRKTPMVLLGCIALVISTGCTPEVAVVEDDGNVTVPTNYSGLTEDEISQVANFFNPAMDPVVDRRATTWSASYYDDARGLQVTIEHTVTSEPNEQIPLDDPALSPTRDLMDMFQEEISGYLSNANTEYRGPLLNEVADLSHFFNAQLDPVMQTTSDGFQVMIEDPALGGRMIEVESSSPPPLVDTEGPTFYVATNGVDASDRGSADRPFASMHYAVDHIPDGSTVIVRPGTYHGHQHMWDITHFEQGVRFVSEVPYQAKLRSTDKMAISIVGSSNITIEGFDIAHGGPGAGSLVFQVGTWFQGQQTHNIVIRNNIIHDSYNNDVLKINAAENLVGSLRDILVEGNMLFNQQGSDEHIDLNSCERVTIQDNIFFNDFEASGRSIQDTANFIVIKRSAAARGASESRDHVLRRNVFLNWQGNENNGFIRLAEDSQPVFELEDSIIENNLFLCNSDERQGYAIAAFATNNVIIRNNTIVGEMSVRKAFSGIISDPGFVRNQNLQYYNNIFSRPNMTYVTKFFMGSDAGNPTFHNNLVWPAADMWHDPSFDDFPIDRRAVTHADPMLPSQDGLVVPHWNGQRFADGSQTIREAFERLVRDYGTPAASSPVIDAGDPSRAPAEDILGNPRDGSPDLGVCERQ